MAKSKPKLYGLTGDSVKRVRRVCERVEGTPPNRPLGDPSGGRFWNPGILRGKVTTAIPSGTFAAPSSTGKVQLYELDHDGTWITAGDPVEVKNQFGGDPVAVDTAVMIAWIGGEWFVVAADCPPEA